jgi:hypothetical protein
MSHFPMHLESLKAPDQDLINRLIDAGISPSAIAQPDPIIQVRGFRSGDGYFEEDPAYGQRWLGFVEKGEQPVFWQPDTGAFASEWGRPFCLFPGHIFDAATYALHGKLVVFAEPIEWLRHYRKGIVVLDWSSAFHHLSYCERIEIPASLVPSYQKAMEWSGPEVFVRKSERSDHHEPA